MASLIFLTLCYVNVRLYYCTKCPHGQFSSLMVGVHPVTGSLQVTIPANLSHSKDFKNGTHVLCLTLSNKEMDWRTKVDGKVRGVAMQMHKDKYSVVCE